MTTSNPRYGPVNWARRPSARVAQIPKGKRISASIVMGITRVCLGLHVHAEHGERGAFVCADNWRGRCLVSKCLKCCISGLKLRAGSNPCVGWDEGIFQLKWSRSRHNSPYLPLWWGWAPDCCRRTAGRPERSVSSWWRARMGWAPKRFDYMVETPDLLVGPLGVSRAGHLLFVPSHPSRSPLMCGFLPLSSSPTPSSSTLLYPARPFWSLLTHRLVDAAIRQRHIRNTPPPSSRTALQSPPSYHPLSPNMRDCPPRPTNTIYRWRLEGSRTHV